MFDEIAVNDTGDSGGLPILKANRTRAKRYRAEHIPQIPTDMDDVVIEADGGGHVEASGSSVISTTTGGSQSTRQKGCCMHEGDAAC
jgi:hypothetical protein